MSTLFVPAVFQPVLTPMTELVTTGCTMLTIDTSFTSPHLKLGERFVEVEARLGKHGDKGFTSGVTPAMFDSIENKLQSFKGWSFASQQWECVHDYLYTVDDHVIRTRKVFLQDVLVEHVVKKRIKNVDVVCSGKPPALFNTVDIRGSLSVEQHVVLPEGFTVHPSLVTHKLQKRFKYKNWFFALSKTQRPDVEEVLEVEIEYTHLEEATGNTDVQQYIALGLLMKLVDFYPVFGMPYVLLPAKK
jgi:hypothetical protein